MKSIDEITSEMGDIWVERVKERARRVYDRMENRDLSKREYINSFVRHAYDSVQQAKQGR